VRAGAPLTRAVPGDGGRAPILIVDGLVKRYGGVHAVDGASFTAAAGGITGLIGPNGAGKSTVLGLVSGFVRPDAGRITFDGRDVAVLPAHRRARLGIVRTFQLPREFRALTTIENLLVAAPGQRGESAAGVAAGRWRWRRDEDELAEAARWLLRLFGMAEAADERAGRLSGGQKRMLEVMRALMARPRLLLLDEPMAGLAPALAERLEAACRQLAAAGMSILLVEHELGVVERLCETVVVMAQGKVISEGRMAELRTRKEVQDAYVRGVDLTVGEGQLVAVVGPNGAGKSTLLKAILGLARVMGGRVLADGRDITGRPLDQLARLGIGYVPQVDDVFDPLKVSENLNMGGYLLGKADRIARIEEVLAIFPALRSKLNRYVGTMSGGERKMTAIARALMLSPRVLVLDEPTAGLSAVLTESVLAGQVRALADRGHAVLLVEQKAQAALRLAHTASVLVRGQVVMSAPAAEVLASRKVAEVFLGGRGRRQK
jgi:ABC-type branched-subunit amino acid transport system ATPase component